MFQKTEEHRAIENSVASGKHTVVSAGPGSGKTTTLKMVVFPKMMATRKTLVHGIVGGAVTFNNTNANILKTELNSPHIKAGTTCSVFKQAIEAVKGRVKVEVDSSGRSFKGRYYPATKDKNWRIVAALWPEEKEIDFSLLLRIVALMKVNAFGFPGYPSPDETSAIEKLMLAHNIMVDDEPQKFIGMASKLFAASLADSAYNFEDMLYRALQYRTVPAWEFCLYDEAQDIKPIEFELLKLMAGKGCQIVAVGDSCQAINFFAGCMVDGLAELAKTLEVLPLPLRTSYRCSVAAAEKANEVFPGTVIPHANAKPGSIEYISLEELNLKELDFNSGILARVHKFLIPMAIKLLADKINFTYKGIADLVQRMNTMLWHAEKAHPGNLSAMRQNLTEYQAILEDKYTGANGVPPWLAQRAETTDSLCLLLAHCEGQGQGIDCVKSYLNSLADTEKMSDGPCLSTTHAAKGMQWESVYLVGDMISPLAKTEEQLWAEKCLEYVAYSRSSDRLIFVQKEVAAE